MIFGYAASRGRNPKMDLRDEVSRLKLDLKAENENERRELAQIRLAVAEAARRGCGFSIVVFDEHGQEVKYTEVLG